MHLLVRETHALDEGEAAVDLGQSPAELVVLSFSDSDLGALAGAWQGMGPARPGLRLASLARLKHPMSVDMYVEDVVARARCVVVRLLGGLEYWRYGAEEVAAACRRAGIPLALVPGDGRDDAELAALSTMAPALRTRLDALLAEGGPANMQAALRLAAHAGGLAPDPGAPPAPVQLFGEHALAGADPAGALAVIVFYRSYLLADDLAPVAALAAALRIRGLAVRALFVASLKEPGGADFVAATLASWRPAVVLNATGFAAARDGASPLDAAAAPVLQLVLSGSAEAAWAASARGLSPADLAMQVVLPELDGRLSTAAISFKETEPAVPGLEFARMVHRPHEAGIAIAADRAAGWARLAVTPRAERVVALVLSNYPGAAGQVAHAVGLDAFASAGAILGRLAAEGYATREVALVAKLTADAPTPILSLAEYEALLAGLPAAAQARLRDAWGAPAQDPAVQDGHFTLRHLRAGHVVVAVEPDRGSALDRKSGYHDPDLPPRHAHVAFHLWLRHRVGIHALLHLGAHGTLEWLPGKAVALSSACFPQALLGGTPVVYPFIANNPGEAAAASRRLGAVTIGHLTPPLRDAGLHGAAAGLERSIDEYAAADGLDRRRGVLLQRSILEQAESLGLLAEAGADRLDDPDAALARLDAYLCDVKALQIRDGLHVFGTAPAPDAQARLLEALVRACPTVPAELLRARLDASPGGEWRGLLDALDGRFVKPGPAGAPSRGRADVLPTGRNLTATDPRTMPTPGALRLAEAAAADLLARHRQDHGEWPRSLVLNLWGSASLRTGGEDLGLAFVLLGARPVWDAGSARVTGIEVLPLAVLDRPRVDVTLRISGLFRDAFETQIALFDSAVRAVAARDEAADWNPLAGRGGARVFGPAPGAYGAGIADRLARGAWTERAELARDYLAASGTAYGAAGTADDFAALLAAADALLHIQDHRELDLLEGSAHAAHEGGMAAAAAALGGTPAVYHADTSRPEAPRTASLAEEIARVVRGRAANPLWLAGMQRHGYRGAAEIARSVEALCAFAATLPDRLDRQLDLLFDATLGDAAVAAFLARENPAALADMQARFRDAQARGLWRPRRNHLPGDPA